VTGRSQPFHLHIARSLLYLTRHTETYVPISPYILPILTTTLTQGSKPKRSTLRPLDFESNIRVPQQYVKTRVYYEGLTEETAYCLSEWLSSNAVHGSVAFPEIIIPIVAALRKGLKSTKAGVCSAKEAQLIKTLIERIEDSARWVEKKRSKLTLAPDKIDQVRGWEQDLRSTLDEAPLRKYVVTQRKARENRRRLVEKVSQAFLLSDPSYSLILVGPRRGR
jgi:nucleolar complex protein 2